MAKLVARQKKEETQQSRQRQNRHSPATPQVAAPWPLHRSEILQLQQTQGNRAVQRHLANRSGVIQRDPKGAQSGQPARKQKSAADALPTGFPHKTAYDILAKLLGDASLQTYAGKIAETGRDLLMAQVRAARQREEDEGETDTKAPAKLNFVEEAQLNQIGQRLAADLQTGVMDILNSPAGAKIKQTILREAKQEPVVAVGLVLLALGTALATGLEIPIPEIKTRNGATISGKGQTGGVDGPVVEALEVTFSKAGHYFLAGGYSDKKDDQSKQLEKTVKFATGVTLDPGGLLHLSLDSALRLSDSADMDRGEKPKRWQGAAALRVGNAQTFITQRLEVADDGKVALRLTPQLANVLGVKQLTASATMRLTLEPKLQVADAGLQLSYEHTSADKNDPLQMLKVSLTGQYSNSGGQQPGNIQVMFLLTGSFR